MRSYPTTAAELQSREKKKLAVLLPLVALITGAILVLDLCPVGDSLEIGRKVLLAIFAVVAVLCWKSTVLLFVAHREHKTETNRTRR